MITIAELAGLFVAIALAVVIVPLVRWAARRVGLVDNPDQTRKLQTHAVALGGGIGVLASCLIAYLLISAADPQRYVGNAIQLRYLWIFLGAFALLVIGLIDDAIGLRGRQKLLAQVLVVSALVGVGTKINVIGLFGHNIDLGPLAFPLSVLWLLVAVNALNLIDGADGMASTVGAIVLVGLGLLSALSGASLNALLAFTLAGALLGFLVYNRPPATIYLGDAGSMMIGLFVGVLAAWSRHKEMTFLSSAPIAILALPLFDSSAAIIRRWLTGRSLYTTDRAHLHHLLQHRYGPVGMLWFVAGLCGLTTASAVLATYLRMPWVAGLGLVGVLFILISSRSFGHAEANLLYRRAAGFAQSFTVSAKRAADGSQNRVVPLQGDGPWETVWEPLVQVAKSNGWSRIKIDIAMAWVHEGFHANWQAMQMPEKADQLNMSLPLFAHRSGERASVQIGRLQIVVPADDRHVYERIGTLTDCLNDLAPEIDRIVASLEGDAAKPVSPAVARQPSPVIEDSVLLPTSGHAVELNSPV